VPITITAFAASPDRGRGLARDMRVRWALEEAGLPYQVRLLSFAEMKQPDHIALHPFGQIPTFEDGTITLFESGAILLHVSEQSPVLLPSDPPARARAIGWLFAALNTVEPPIVDYTMTLVFERDRPWHADRLAALEPQLRTRLQQLSDRLGDADWLDGDFSVGDLMMVTVLRRLESSGILGDFPRLTAYIARGTARPAYARAFAAQRAVFTASQSAP
jgi:glutathione S-transferase